MVPALTDNSSFLFLSFVCFWFIETAADSFMPPPCGVGGGGKALSFKGDY
jgi:hypothetical protein